MTAPLCQTGHICTHEGPCHAKCGGDHTYHTDGTCLRCGKFEFEKATGKPLVPKHRVLTLWNGPWGPQNREHCYIAAFSLNDAVALLVGAGASEYGLLNAIRNYWSKAWGNPMMGITPERGVWIAEGYSDAPKRRGLDFAKQLHFKSAKSSKRITPPTAAQVTSAPKKTPQDLGVFEWREALTQELALTRSRVMADKPGGDPAARALKDQHRLKLLEELAELDLSED